MKKAEISYPCWWTYALIGRDEEELLLAIGQITAGTQHRVAFSKQSAKKKYVSLHVDIWVTTQDERDDFFDAFKTHPAVRALL